MLLASAVDDFAKKTVIPSVLTLAFALGMPMEANSELPSPNHIVAQAWSIVDATYVDRTFNNQDWFKIRQDVVKRK